jgi:hypothetical protein
MPENGEVAPGVCPVCASAVADGRPIGGIWTGSAKSKARNGPMHATVCAKCGTKLLAMPTWEESEAGHLVWERDRSDDD